MGIGPRFQVGPEDASPSWAIEAIQRLEARIQELEARLVELEVRAAHEDTLAREQAE